MTDKNLISSLRPSDVKVCRNLRPVEGAEGLFAVAPPERFALPDGWQVLVDDRAAGRVLAARGREVGFVSRGLVPKPFMLDADVDTGRAQTVGDCVYLADIHGNDYSLRVDPDSLVLTAVPDAAETAPVLRAVAAGTVMTTLTPCRLAGAYPAEETLLEADIAAMRRSAADTYRRLDRLARASAVCWQPVMAAVRMLDPSGVEIYRSEPVLCVHPAGLQFEGRFVFTTTSAGYTAATEVEAPAYRLSVDASALPPQVSGRVGTVEVLATPVLYLHRLDVGASVAAVRTTVRDVLAHAVMVPSAVGEGVSPGEGRPRHLLDIVARFDQLARVVWSASAAALTARPSATVPMNPAGDVDADAARLSAALGRAVETRPYDGVMLSQPHLMAASMAARGASSLLYAGIRVSRANPRPVRLMAATEGDGQWQAAVTVAFADGSTQVRTDSGTGAAPLTFGPMLSYPAPDAVSMTISVSHGGTVRTGTFTLVPDPSGRCAVYVHRTLQPFQLGAAGGAFAVPEARPQKVELAGVIAAADASSPRRAAAWARISAGDVTALAAARFGQSSWDFGRARFYVFATSGIHLLSTDTARGTMSMSVIDSRVVAGADAVADTDTAVAAIASGDVLELSGSRAVHVADAGGATALVWNGADRELWCLGDDHTRVLCAAYGYGCYTMPEVYTREGGGMLVGADGTRCRPGHRAMFLSADVEWQMQTDRSTPLCGVAEVRVDAQGVFDALAVDIRRCHGAMVSPAPDVRLTLTGRFVAPVARRVIVHHMRRTCTTIAGTLPAGTPLPRVDIVSLSKNSKKTCR